MDLKIDPLSNARFFLLSDLPVVQEDSSEIQAAPQTFNEDVFEEPAITVLRDAYAESSN